jgi:hypothetical protein
LPDCYRQNPLEDIEQAGRKKHKRNYLRVVRERLVCAQRSERLKHSVNEEEFFLAPLSWAMILLVEEEETESLAAGSPEKGEEH